MFNVHLTEDCKGQRIINIPIRTTPKQYLYTAADTNYYFHLTQLPMIMIMWCEAKFGKCLYF